jgi:hypothetical protein
MSRSRLICLTSACIAVGALGFAPPARADVPCTGTIGAVLIMDNVNVPPGASCTLNGTIITGNVIVNQNSHLLTQSANVAGNIQGEGATRVRIFNTVVTNIQLKKATWQIIISSDQSCTADPLVLGRIQLEENSANIGICRMSTRQDVQLTKNTGRISVVENMIGEDLQVVENTKLVQLRLNEVGLMGTGDMQVNKNSGGVVVAGNTVVDTLQCKENTPFLIGKGNTAAVKEDQCAGV